MNCLNCNTLTKNPKFCSRSCAATINNQLSPKRKINKLCLYCTEQVKDYRSNKCLYHHTQYGNTLLADKSLEEVQSRLSTRNKHRSWINAAIRNHNRVHNKGLLKLPCAKCGYSKHVELAHIKGISEFLPSTLVKEINSPTNVIQLCPNCHWEFDNLPR